MDDSTVEGTENVEASATVEDDTAEWDMSTPDDTERKNTVDRQHYYSENEEQVNTYSYDAQFFENFEQLLQSADGKLKSVKSAKQNRYQAETIAFVIGAATPLGIF